MSASANESGRSKLSTVLFASTLFTSAALLFLVEPMFAKMALPLLGGSASVWTTCLVFFQITLLAGYAYAHGLMKFAGLRGQIAVHSAILLTALALLPIHVPAGWTPPREPNPAWWLLRLLVVAVGLPFFALSATTPILQKWFSLSGHASARNPYFLYAASNAGSLLGLLAYPFALEPLLLLSQQSRLWTCCYAVFLLLAAACVLWLWKSSPGAFQIARKPFESDVEASLPRHPLNADEWKWRGEPTATKYPAAGPGKSAATRAPGTADGANYVTLLRRFKWVAYAFVPSSLMLGVTTALTTDVPAIPLLWVLPLAIYLLSFVLVFARKPPLPHAWLVRRMPFMLLAAALPGLLKSVVPFVFLVLIDLAALFVAAMVCHGELARLRPTPERLTEFYLWVSVGGVLGGAFNALIAPVLFRSVAEFPIALVLAALLRPALDAKDETSRARWLDYLLPATLGAGVAAAIWVMQARAVVPGRMFNLLVFAPAALCCLSFGTRPRRFAVGLAALIFASGLYAGPYGRFLHTERSFYGVYRVSTDAGKNVRLLLHGSTVHGVQSLDPALACEPLAYYTRSGPIGRVFAALAGKPILDNVAVVGLGAGVMASYQQPGQKVTFYEIDPAVLHIAQDPQYFTYLSACGSRPTVVLGDARQSFSAVPQSTYGLLVLDAFSGDSIPTHLLTREALLLFRTKLAPHGVMAFHISNRFLDLHAVLAGLAQDAGLVCLSNIDAQVSAEESRAGKFPSWWVVMARSRDDLGSIPTDPRWTILRATPEARVWTDDYSNIVSTLKFK